ncbi:hypothetical protein Q5P01_000145 [Channa striata]|uniref:Uncharacterized protein n=1 Tax=Channa striata TaxID=64152 RepID=A0AA88LMS1_CHASR|nr:hypothetical protein Q5P01_000145 [Channa striata]
MTDGLKVSPSDWGQCGRGVESLSPVQSSPKEQRSQRRSSMPAAQLHGDAGPQPGVGVGGLTCWRGSFSGSRSDPTMIPEVHYHTPVVHVAQWTEVRYGRRGRRPRGAFHQVLTEERQGTGARGMDNAFQVPRKVVPIHTFHPNRLVPPSGFLPPARSTIPSRAYGPQRRSYAEVVRWNAPRQVRDRGYSPRRQVGRVPGVLQHHTAETQRSPPADPNFVGQGKGGADQPAQENEDAGQTAQKNGDAGQTVQVNGDAGQTAPEEVREVHVERRRGGRGAVLPESQSRFLEEIVELSSAADSTSGRVGAAAPRTAETTAVMPGGERRPVLAEHAVSPEGGGELLDLVSGPPQARVMCSVATMTDGLKVSPSDWGGSAGGGVESLSPVQSSPKEQRSQRRSSMPAAQLHGDAGPQPGVGVGGPHLLEGDHLVDLDQTPTMIPEVHYRTPVVHVAQWTEVRSRPQGRAPRRFSPGFDGGAAGDGSQRDGQCIPGAT